MSAGSRSRGSTDVILDFQNNAAQAIRFAVFDRETGERIDDSHALCYADDQAGVWRELVRDENRAYVFDPKTGYWQVREHKRAIDIVPKA